MSKSEEILRDEKAFITDTLGRLIRSGNLKADDVGKALYRVMAQTEKMGLKGKALVRFLYEQADPLVERLNYKSTCRSCTLASCCSMRVTCTKPEAQVILDYVKKHKIKVDLSLLRRQTRATTTSDWTKQDKEDRACAFLDRETRRCKIYPVRPIQCRKYTVKDDPRKCDPGIPNNSVQILVSNEVEIYAAVLLNLFKDLGLAQAFLDSVEGR